MAQLPTSDIYTIHDSVSLQDPSGRNVRYIINLLAKLTPVYRNGKFTPASHGTYHLNTFQTSSVGAARTTANKGFLLNKGTFSSERDNMGTLGNVSTVDKRTVGPYQSLSRVRQIAADVIITDIANQFETDFFYANSASDPLSFDGLATRYNSLTGTRGQMVVDGGGLASGNTQLTSMWLVSWGDRQCNIIHPPNMPAGVYREDRGEWRVLDRDGNPYFAYEEYISMCSGLTLGDFTFTGRVANIDVEEAQAGNVNLFSLLQELVYERLKARWNADLNDWSKSPTGRQVIYMNRQMFSALITLGRNAGASDNFVRLTPMTIEGKEYPSYMGTPIEVTDAIVNTETLVA